MSGFKLLAIRPLGDCDKQFLKNLKPGMVYKFYQNYDYFVGEEKLTESNYDNFKSHSVNEVKFIGNDNDLYSKPNGLNINISAVVGKNGSGKSALMELFFFWLFKISVKSEFIDLIGEKDNLQKELKNNMNDKKYEVDTHFVFERIRTINKKLAYYKNDLNIDVFFEIHGKVFCIGNVNEKEIENEYENVYEEEEQTKLDFKDFFYSIALNYSIYGMNSIISGEWLDRMFHKNDGYRIPLVINPKRENGIINVNNEIFLAKNRTIKSLIDKKSIKKILVEKKEIEEISFEIPEINQFDNDFEFVFRNNGQNKIDMIKQKISPRGFYGNRDSENLKLDIIELMGLDEGILWSVGKEWKFNFSNYFNRKIFKMVTKYSEFRKYLLENTNELIISDIENFIKILKEDKSHKTLKFRQLFNVLNFKILNEADKDDLSYKLGKKINEDIRWEKNTLKLKFDVFAEIIYKTKEKHPNFEIEEILPNSFFKISFRIKGEENFEDLSSGEQQFINSISTIIYHVLNIDSIPNHYQSVNVIFDEVELYFHPDFQRKFIYELIRSLNNLKLDNVKNINILFLTHSSFILSDIPSGNILCLEEGKVKEKLEETFAANIHDLLAHNFFLNDGFIGEFAKEKIKSLIDFLDPNKIQKTLKQKTKNRWNLQKAEEFIEIIGEPFLKSDLQELLIGYKKRNFGEKEWLEDEIKYLTRRLKNLEK